MPKWLLIILDFFLSDLFGQLVEWAKDIVSQLTDSVVTDKGMTRDQAVTMLRTKADLEGHKITRWEAGQAVEAAYAELYIKRFRG